jgi:type IV pilus assembly protein PilA
MVTRNEKGFTLIELMIVIAIIGILAAIAIPQFSAYRARSYNAAAMSDVRNMMTACEAYFVDWDAYPTGVPSVVFSNYGYVPSAGVTVTADISGGTTGYTIPETYNLSAGAQAVTYSVTGPGQSIVKANP